MTVVFGTHFWGCRSSSSCSGGCLSFAPLSNPALLVPGLVRTFVLRSQHSFKRAFYVLPLLVTLTFFIVVVFIMQTNNKTGR